MKTFRYCEAMYCFDRATFKSAQRIFVAVVRSLMFNPLRALLWQVLNCTCRATKVLGL